MREDRMMNEKKQSAVKRILGTRGMGAVITAFAGLIIIYVAFGLIDRKVFAGMGGFLAELCTIKPRLINI